MLNVSDTWRHIKAASRLVARHLAAAWRVLISPLSGCTIVYRIYLLINPSALRRKKKSKNRKRKK
ncbi:hypothetical protein LZ31DRAFT_553364 [Colletotrichum somersetense]|nr:hypothetical protein LZ31DRAFT_553364 [Colletotrichum somersetense]